MRSIKTKRALKREVVTEFKKAHAQKKFTNDENSTTAVVAQDSDYLFAFSLSQR